MATRQPLPRDSHAAAGIGSKLYVWGGDGGSSKIKSTALEIFVVTSVQWEEQKALRGYDMPDGLEGMAVMSDGETAYCCCSRTGSYPNEDACTRWRCLHDSSYAVCTVHCTFCQSQSPLHFIATSFFSLLHTFYCIEHSH